MDRLQSFTADCSALGGTLFYVLLTVFLFLAGFSGHGYTLVAGFVGTEVGGRLIRVMYPKQRPGDFTYRNRFEAVMERSFPSIHVARAAFFAAFLGAVFSTVLTWVFAGVLTGLVGYGRVALNRHDWWDVAGGAVLGVAVYVVVAM